MKKRSLAVKIARYAGAFIIMLMLFALMLFAKKPVYLIGGVEINNIETPAAKTKIENIIQNFSQTAQIKFLYNDKTFTLKPSEIGAKWDIEKTIAHLKKYNRISFITEPAAAPVYAAIDKEKLAALIKNAYKDEIKEMKPAKIISIAGVLDIAKEQEGAELQEYLLNQETLIRLENLSEEKIPIYLTRIVPPITSEDLAVYFDELKTVLRLQMTLKYGWLSYNFLPVNYLDGIYYQKEYGAENGEKIKIKINPDSAIKPFISQITKAINKQTAPVKIYKNDKGKIIFEGESETGEEVQTSELINRMEDAINSGETSVKIPVTETPPSVTASEDLKAMGIKELIGVGHTSFYGSPKNRIHNIGVGVARFNGIIIEPNEIFSFNKALGRVDASTGYLEELTIKPEGTIPEYGGGLCQVSTTMYRAAIYTGLPIVERAAHSYAVRYYSQIGGHGLDATIYPGGHDLRFKNDTPGAILIQSYARGEEAFYKFYGTSDGRKVELDGPYLSDFVSAGGKEIVKTLKLPAGRQKQLEKAGKGFKALWYRTIVYADGTTIKEEIKSKYRATADKILIGVDPNSEEGKTLQQAQPAQPATKQFTD